MKTVKSIFNDFILVGEWDKDEDLFNYNIHPILTDSKSGVTILYYIDDITIMSGSLENERMARNIEELQSTIGYIKKRITEYGSRDACAFAILSNTNNITGIAHFEKDSYDYYHIFSNENGQYWNVHVKDTKDLTVEYQDEHFDSYIVKATLVDPTIVQFVE